MQHINLGKSVYKCILALVKTDAFTGKKSEQSYKFPIDFDGVSIKKICLNISNADVDSFNDVNSDHFLSEYLRLFEMNNMLNKSGAASITYDQFKKGLFFQVFNISTSLRESPLLLPVVKE